MARTKPCCGECANEVDDKTVATKQGVKWYHNDCLAKRETRIADMYELYEYLVEIFHLQDKIPTPLMMKQIKTFKEEYNYTYKGMYLTLKYFHETLGNPVDSRGIGIIPYVYEDAKQHRIEINKIKKESASMVVNENGSGVVIEHVTIKKTKDDYQNSFLQMQLIDISDII